MNIGEFAATVDDSMDPSAARQVENGEVNAEAATANEEIDDTLYNRQRYVLGDEAMKKIRKSSVLVMGLSGVGVEVAKNLLLAGVGRVGLWDPTDVHRFDLSSNYCASDESIGTNRVVHCKPLLEALNPGCTVEAFQGEIEDENIEHIREHYDCVVVNGWEVSIEKRMLLNDKLRSSHSKHPIPFVSADCFGILGSVFVDFGDSFIARDPGLGDNKEYIIGAAEKHRLGTLITPINARKDIVSKGDSIALTSVPKDGQLSHAKFTVLDCPTENSFVVNTSVDICDKLQGASFRSTPKPIKMRFRSLRTQLTSPDIYQCEMINHQAHIEGHIAWVALMTYHKRFGRCPETWDREDCSRLAQLAREQAQAFDIADIIDRMFMKLVACTCRAQLGPLAAFVGSFAAQEVLKALTSKFLPLKQFLHIDYRDLVPRSAPVPSFRPRGDRFDGHRMLFGDAFIKKLADLRIFLVGAGAIGCELLKNIALLGIGSAKDGLISLTDDDHIEKSNLNRQFLFHNEHIGMSKSVVAGQQVQRINGNINVNTYEMRVDASSETTFDDAFFSKQTLCLLALDNMQARKYMDQKCVSVRRPLFDSGTLGTSGHTFVVIPFVTEQYTAREDPPDDIDAQIPYCTLKSFPYQIEHCIEWAREKFYSLFTAKPSIFEKFFSNNGGTLDEVLENLNSTSVPMDGTHVVMRMLEKWPLQWQDCVDLAIGKFMKYFNYKARQLLHSFPEDFKTTDGKLFWSPPKMPPKPVELDLDNPVHLTFLLSCSKIFARCRGLPADQIAQITAENVETVVKAYAFQDFVPSNTKSTIATDVNETKPVKEENVSAISDLQEHIRKIINSAKFKPNSQIHATQEFFDKDNESNSHIEFVHATANLRAQMYSIENVDKYQVKRIAGRIAPAIATTTACVAGLITMELLKYTYESHKLDNEMLNDNEIEACLKKFRHAFLNLAEPSLVFVQPDGPKKSKLPNGQMISCWDRWELGFNDNGENTDAPTLRNITKQVLSEHKIHLTTFIHGSTLLYLEGVSDLSRFDMDIRDLISIEKQIPSSVEVTVDYERTSSSDADIPSIRLLFNQSDLITSSN